jgi:hypothetical protein
MLVIAYAQLTCDSCNRSLVVLASRTAPPTKFNIKRILRRLEVLAARHQWRMEGPSMWAGDMCETCKRYEAPDFAPEQAWP